VNIRKEEVFMGTAPGRTTETKSVLLVEKHAAFRQALAHVLELCAGFKQTYQAESLAETRDCAPGAVDLAIVDLGLSNGDGLDVVRALREAHPRATVLALTFGQNPICHARTVRAGANMVLSKESSLAEILRVARSLGG
jgi:DNA-binding NarL/FixJ family response regulator